MAEESATREHILILEKGKHENIVSVKCSDCGQKLDSPLAWHPKQACLLFKNGFDPEQFILESYPHIRKPDTHYGGQTIRLASKGDRA